MRGMAIVGPHEMPGLPSQSQVMDFNTVANDLFNNGQYKEAVVEYSRALGRTLRYVADGRFRTSRPIDTME